MGNNIVYPIPPCTNPAGHNFQETEETVVVANRTHAVEICTHCGTKNPPVGDQQIATTLPIRRPDSGLKPLGS